ncbi:hypothetical protein J1P26_02685 [Neobacillus sp. MM2021_6]|uniref:hypothetical protein n=1 Tax=Bacillaceae TaxID=186817 RepID=UPI00140A605D|nr:MULTISPECIES: hypothetical protein [Bacillaceae]MBO0958625.1 hypothetical protein [Neobacillus sp. MM2021_6]NHC17998.1 hypothetical protein [Bacillus sp. MM2020_4]
MRKLLEVMKLYYRVNISYEIRTGAIVKLLLRCVILLLFITGIAILSFMPNIPWMSGEELYFYILLFFLSITQYISHFVKNEFNYYYINRFPVKSHEALLLRLVYRNLDITSIACHIIGLIILSMKFAMTFSLLANFLVYILCIQIVTEILNAAGTKLYINKNLYILFISLFLTLILAFAYFRLFLPNYLLYSLQHPSYGHTLGLIGTALLLTGVYKLVYSMDFRLKSCKGFSLNFSFVFEFLIKRLVFIDKPLRYLIAKDFILMLRTKKHVFFYCFLLSLTFFSNDVGAENSIFYNLLIAFPVQVCINSFSLDQKGVISIFQTNVNRRDVFLAKNIVSGLLIILLYIIFSTIFFIMGGTTLFNAGKLFLFMIPALFFLLPLCNYLSVTFPLKETDSGGALFATINFKSIIIYTVISILVLTVFTVLAYFYKNQLFIPFLIASTGLGYLFYLKSLDKVVKKLNDKERKIITKLLFSRG